MWERERRDGKVRWFLPNEKQGEKKAAWGAGIPVVYQTGEGLLGGVLAEKGVSGGLSRRDLTVW